MDILLINAPETDLVYQSARMVILGPDVRTIGAETFAENSNSNSGAYAFMDCEIYKLQNIIFLKLIRVANLN